jgi:LPS export ABC transporter protein LptC
MRRTRLRTALLVVVAAAVGGIGVLVARSVRHRPLALLGEDFLPQVAQRIQNFRRLKVKDGRPVWEITARDAQYFESDNALVVHEPRLTFYLDGGTRRAHVAGAEGHLVLEGRDLRSLTLRGGVSVRLDDLELETEEATYDRATDLITSAAVVTVHGRLLDVRGKGMEVEVGPQLVRLLDDVQTTVRFDGAAS